MGSDSVSHVIDAVLRKDPLLPGIVWITACPPCEATSFYYCKVNQPISLEKGSLFSRWKGNIVSQTGFSSLNAVPIPPGCPSSRCLGKGSSTHPSEGVCRE